MSKQDEIDSLLEQMDERAKTIRELETSKQHWVQRALMAETKVQLLERVLGLAEKLASKILN